MANAPVATNKDYRVSLIRAASLQRGQNLEKVVWEATPDFSESRSVMYKNIDPIHAPGAIYQYANTGSRVFSIQGKFISRSVNEATKTLTYIQYLRTWSMPVFGSVGNNPPAGEDILGAPPAVLLLSAYSTSPPGDFSQTTVPDNNMSSRKLPALGSNIFQVPVVITNIDIPFPSDVDYIPTINNYPVPTIVTVSVQLTETHSPNKYQNFNLQDFKNGNLINF